MTVDETESDNQEEHTKVSDSDINDEQQKIIAEQGAKLKNIHDIVTACLTK